MDRIITGPPIVSPTLALKQPDIPNIPDVQNLSDPDFLKFVDSGIYVVIDTPLVKNSRNSLFAINVDGFIPLWNTSDTVSARVFKNFFPVQVLPSALSFVKVFQEMIALPQQFLYASHRKIRGSVGVGLRVTSNTGQAGNFSISQGSGLLRQFYRNSENYAGLRFLNTSYNGGDFSPSNFILADVSLNRNVSITTTKRECVQYLDLPQKIRMFGLNEQPSNTLADLHNINVRASQFLEDWLFFSILGNFPNQNQNQVTIRIFFDFSQVEFETPMLPVVPSVPTSPEKQILAYSTTFNGFQNPNKATWVFLPGAPTLDETEEDYLKRAKSSVVDDSDLYPVEDVFP